MTTSVRVINEGPLRVRITVMDGDKIGHVAMLDATHVSSAICMYENRTINIEEVKPQQGA